MENPDQLGPQKINLVSLIRRTLNKVFVTAQLPETDAMVRTVATCLIHVAADYVQALGDDPKHAEALFHAFLTGNDEERRTAVQAFGEAFAPKADAPKDTTEAGSRGRDGSL